MNVKEIRSWLGIAIVFLGMVFQMGRMSNQLDTVTKSVEELRNDLKNFIQETNSRRERGIAQ